MSNGSGFAFPQEPLQNLCPQYPRPSVTLPAQAGQILSVLQSLDAFLSAFYLSSMTPKSSQSYTRLCEVCLNWPERLGLISTRDSVYSSAPQRTQGSV